MRKKLFILMLPMLLFYTSITFGQQATITNVILDNFNNSLIFSLDVKGSFTEEITNAIKSGAPVSFSFAISLYKVKNLWFDEQLSEIDLTHTIKYDNLKNEYIITRSEDNNKLVIVKSFEDAQEFMKNIDKLKVIPINDIEKGSQYQIRAKAKLSKVTLPYSLHRVFLFVSFWDFETDWYSIDFIY